MSGSPGKSGNGLCQMRDERDQSNKIRLQHRQMSHNIMHPSWPMKVCLCFSWTILQEKRPWLLTTMLVQLQQPAWMRPPCFLSWMASLLWLQMTAVQHHACQVTTGEMPEPLLEFSPFSNGSPNLVHYLKWLWRVNDQPDVSSTYFKVSELKKLLYLIKHVKSAVICKEFAVWKKNLIKILHFQ